MDNKQELALEQELTRRISDKSLLDKIISDYRFAIKLKDNKGAWQDESGIIYIDTKHCLSGNLVAIDVDGSYKILAMS